MPPADGGQPTSPVVVLITGIVKSKAEQLRADIAKLGGHVVSTATRTCTHLLANRVSRTVKFLTALSVVKHVVTPAWVEACVKEEKFIGKFAIVIARRERKKVPDYFCFRAL